MNRSTTVGVQGQKGGHPVRDADTTPEISELEHLRAENARLRAVLDAHGIDFQRSLPEPVAPRQSETSRLSTDEKVALFRRLFQGRTDVYPVTLLSALELVSGARVQFAEIVWTVVGQRVALQPSPQVFDGVQVRHVRWQECNLDMSAQAVDVLAYPPNDCGAPSARPR